MFSLRNKKNYLLNYPCYPFLAGVLCTVEILIYHWVFIRMVAVKKFGVSCLLQGCHSQGKISEVPVSKMAQHKEILGLNHRNK